MITQFIEYISKFTPSEILSFIFVFSFLVFLFIILFFIIMGAIDVFPKSIKIGNLILHFSNKKKDEKERLKFLQDQKKKEKELSVLYKRLRFFENKVKLQSNVKEDSDVVDNYTRELLDEINDYQNEINKLNKQLSVYKDKDDNSIHIINDAVNRICDVFFKEAKRSFIENGLLEKEDYEKFIDFKITVYYGLFKTELLSNKDLRLLLRLTNTSIDELLDDLVLGKTKSAFRKLYIEVRNIIIEVENSPNYQRLLKEFKSLRQDCYSKFFNELTPEFYTVLNFNDRQDELESVKKVKTFKEKIIKNMDFFVRKVGLAYHNLMDYKKINISEKQFDCGIGLSNLLRKLFELKFKSIYISLLEKKN